MIIEWTPGWPQRAHETTTCPASSGGPDQAVVVDPILALVVLRLDACVDLLRLGWQAVAFEVQAKRFDPPGEVPVGPPRPFAKHLIDRLVESHALSLGEELNAPRQEHAQAPSTAR
jgi:hypothetical protein